MKPWPPFWVIGVGVVAVLIAGAYGLQILRISGHVDMPARNATPQVVVSAYISALNEHDCDTAAALWVPANAFQGRQWCGDVEHVNATHLGVLNVPNGPHQVTVGAVLDVEKRLISSADSLPANPFGWSFILTRERDGWRISDNGQG